MREIGPRFANSGQKLADVVDIASNLNFGGVMLNLGELGPILGRIPPSSGGVCPIPPEAAPNRPNFGDARCSPASDENRPSAAGCSVASLRDAVTGRTRAHGGETARRWSTAVPRQCSCCALAPSTESCRRRRCPRRHSRPWCSCFPEWLTAQRLGFVLAPGVAQNTARHAASLEVAPT